MQISKSSTGRKRAVKVSITWALKKKNIIAFLQHRGRNAGQTWITLSGIQKKNQQHSESWQSPLENQVEYTPKNVPAFYLRQFWQASFSEIT